jgi:HEAT repeat protein
LGRIEKLDALILRGIRSQRLDRDSEVVQAALIMLGGRGHAQDAPTLGGYLTSPHASLREAAATALGKMDAAGRRVIESALKSESRRTRRLAIIAAAQSSAAPAAELLIPELRHRQPSNRLQAIVGICQPHVPLQAHYDALRSTMESLSAAGSPGVRYLATLKMGCIPDAKPPEPTAN